MHLYLKETFFFVFIVLYLVHVSYCLLVYLKVEHFLFSVQLLPLFFLFFFLTYWAKFNQSALAKKTLILGE